MVRIDSIKSGCHLGILLHISELVLFPFCHAMSLTNVGLDKFSVKSVIVVIASKSVMLAAHTVLLLYGKVEIAGKNRKSTKIATNVVGHGKDGGLSVKVITSMKIAAHDVELAFGSSQVKVGNPAGFDDFPAGVPTFLWLGEAVQKGLLHPKANPPLVRGPMGPEGHQARR